MTSHAILVLSGFLGSLDAHPVFVAINVAASFLTFAYLLHGAQVVCAAIVLASNASTCDPHYNKGA